MTRIGLLALLAGPAFAAQAANKAPAAAPAPGPAPAPAVAKAAADAPCARRKNQLPSGLTILRDCDGAPEMIALRGGHYKMGDTVGDGQLYERPVHEVKLGPFALGRFEVTTGEYMACVAAGSCADPKVTADPQHGRYPVAGVSWTQARIYTEWLASRTGKPYRLPSEAEWEYAARAGNDSRYPWGSFDPDPCRHLNVLDISGLRVHPEWNWAERCEDGFAAAAPVGSFRPNDWGYYDMLGNVWEWVADCWHSDYTGAPADGSAWIGEPCRKHVNRGGGWGNNVHSARLSSRDGDPTGATSDGLGFRVALGLSAADIPPGPDATPDSRPPPQEAPPAPYIMSKKVPVGTMLPAPAAPPKPAGSAPVTSLAIERQFDFHLTSKGEQEWLNGAQHSHGSSANDVDISTRLRSDGLLYGDNLLDPDLKVRLAVKRRFLARRGLVMLKEQSGGKLPRNADELAALMGKAQSSASECKKDPKCIEQANSMFAALALLQDNRAEDLEAELAAPATGPAARWLYFLGYGGCPSSVKLSQQLKIDGVRAFDRAHQHLEQWSLQRSIAANSDIVGDREHVPLCNRYTVTLDVRTGTIFVENLYLPSAFGTTTRNHGGSAEKSDEDMPPPQEVMEWAGQALRQTRESATINASLNANAPFDGDFTGLGSFDGKLEATLTWSFKPVEGSRLAVLPKD